MIRAYDIQNIIPEIRVCNIDERCAKSVMLPRVIVDFVYKERLKTLHIYLDNSKLYDEGYVLTKVTDAIKVYIKWFDNNMV